MLEGNTMSNAYMLRGGKPILVTPAWSYKLEVDRCIAKLILFRDSQSYWTFHDTIEGSDNSSIVRKIMVSLFDFAANLAKDLPTTQIADLLSTIHNITYDLTSILKSHVYWQ